MKRNIYLSALFMFATFCLYAQTVLYTNDFQNPSSFTINNGGNTTNNWLINSIYTGGGFLASIPTVPSQPVSFSNPNGNYLHPRCVSLGGLIPQNANYLIPFGNTISAYMNTSIDASNYSDVTLTFWRTGGANGLSVVYSLDGGTTWTTAVASVAGSPTTWQQVSYTINALDGQPNVRIGFRLSNLVTDPAPNHYHSIDEISITGVESASCETVFGVDKIESCGQITWIDGNTYTENNNTASFLLEGASQNGCDSLVTLNLTIWPCIQLDGNSCGATNVTMDMPLRAINVNAPAYRFRVTGPNNNGPGWAAGSFVHDSPNRAFKFAFIPGSLWGETYGVEVAVGDGVGNFGPYGTSCNVSLISGIPTTQLEAADCGATGVDPNTNLLAIKVTGSTGYRFQVNGPGVAPNTVVEKTMGGGAMRKLKMNQVAGILQGEIYTVEVAIRDAAGNWGAYGTACNVTIFGTPELAINNDSDLSSEREILVDNKSMTLIEFGANTSHNPFTTEFGLQVLNANDSETINVVIYDMSGKLIERHAVNPMVIEHATFGSNLASGMYMIEVKQGSNQVIIRQVKN